MFMLPFLFPYVEMPVAILAQGLKPSPNSGQRTARCSVPRWCTVLCGVGTVFPRTPPRALGSCLAGRRGKARCCGLTLAWLLRKGHRAAGRTRAKTGKGSCSTSTRVIADYLVVVFVRDVYQKGGGYTGIVGCEALPAAARLDRGGAVLGSRYDRNNAGKFADPSGRLAGSHRST